MWQGRVSRRRPAFAGLWRGAVEARRSRSGTLANSSTQTFFLHLFVGVRLPVLGRRRFPAGSFAPVARLSAASNGAPFGLPRPVVGSQPGPALNAPLFPEVISLKAFALWYNSAFTKPARGLPALTSASLILENNPA